MRKASWSLSVLTGSLIFLAGCTGTRVLKEGETFYGGAKIKFDTGGKRVGRKKTLEKELLALILPEPNNKVLGMRLGVWYWDLAGPTESKKGIKGFIKYKLGQAPVLLKDATPDKTAKMLSGYLNNEGYFQSTVGSEIRTRGHESKVIYNVFIIRPYRLRNIHYPKPRDSVYASILSKLAAESLLKERQRFDVGRMQAEQKRIEEILKNEGFYYFDDRYLIFEADSTVGKKKIDVALRLEPGIPKRGKRIYTVNEVSIIPNYTLHWDSLNSTMDTVLVDSYNYIDSKHTFRPEVITRVINIRKGETYSREAQTLTLSHLMGLGVFKFVNVKFSEAYPDSTLLDASIYLTPLKKKSIRAEVQAVSKSNNFVGPGITLTFTNRNFFKGAELFQLKLNAAYEVQISRQNSGPLNSFETGFETSLTFPKFISPIPINYNGRRYLPKTVIKTGFNFQNRVSFYRLNSFNMGYGYIWRETAAKSHELFPIDINFVSTDKRSEAFNDLILSNPALSNAFENQFIIGSHYSYTHNTQLNESTLREFDNQAYKTHHFYFNGNVDIAGNLLSLLQGAVNNSAEESNQLFGSRYSRFVKADVDFRHYFRLDAHNKLVSRIVLGAGYAFGDSATLPYVKQFSIGGSNSIRAFPARSVGPGTYNIRSDNPNSTLFIDQRGDIKLEGNMEYRFDIIKALKGALFMDAGNIWLWKSDSQRPGGEFQQDLFLKQLAVGTGLGLRFDFSFFVLRFDTAFPLRKPYLDTPWVLDNINFSSKTWRKENLVFNIAIGYPF